MSVGAVPMSMRMGMPMRMPGRVRVRVLMWMPMSMPVAMPAPMLVERGPGRTMVVAEVGPVAVTRGVTAGVWVSAHGLPVGSHSLAPAHVTSSVST